MMQSQTIDLEVIASSSGNFNDEAVVNSALGACLLKRFDKR